MNELVERLFFEALERKTGDRASYLQAACQGDSGLQAEVEALLEASEMGDRLISGAVGRAAASILPAPGARVGPYELVRQIGEGGMGVVFLAERVDGQFEQQVAIKFVQGGNTVTARFLQERQILARLVHPNVARLIDGGITEDGTPYMVLEYFPGEPITRYCQRTNLPVAERLRLFQEVCNAVEHAHRSLIIHRDLKPSNILVNEKGELKLLDFGIAKLLHHVPDETLTAAGMHFFTADYASPEQIRGEAVTTATDVYSLGAVLFELLAGTGPHRLDKYTPAEITQVVCVDPAPPLGLDNELDQIVQMALRKEPERRYPSVSHFSEDIGRFLAERPVLARADSAAYRIRKFVRRNVAGVAAAGVALLCLIGGLSVALWQAQVARREALEAQRRFQQVRKLARTVLFEFDDTVRHLAGSMAARELLAKTAVEYLDSLYRDAGHDPGLRRELALAYERIADVQGDPGKPNLGQPQSATRNYQRSAELWESLRERDLTIYARVHLKLYNLSGGDSLPKALAAAEEAKRNAPESAETYALLVRLHRVIGNDHYVWQEISGALAEYRMAVDTAAEWARKIPGDEAEIYLAGALDSLAKALLAAGRPAQAVTTAERIIAIRSRLLKSQPGNPLHRQEISAAHLIRGHAFANPHYLHLGKPAEGAEAYRRAMEIAERLLLDDPRNAMAKRSLAEAQSGMAQVILSADPGRAQALHAQALAYFEEINKTTPRAAVPKVNLAKSRLAMAEISRARKDFSGAGRHIEEALRWFRIPAGRFPTHDYYRQNLVRPLILGAHVALDQRNSDRARGYCDELLAILSSTRRDGKFEGRLPDLADGYHAIGRCREASGLSKEAAGFYRKSLDLWNELAAGGVPKEIVDSRRAPAAAALARF